MSSDDDILVPVFDRYARAYPLHADADVDDGDAATYGLLGDALQTAFEWDAHFAAYSAPEIPRRLAEGALGVGARMILFVVDVEPHGHAAVTPEWWAAERAKLDALFTALPGGFAYRTRGGYRIVYRLRAPLELDALAATAQWTASYLAWLDVLRDGLEIAADRKCADPWHLFRLPRVVREGVVQDPEFVGDPHAVGFWDGDYEPRPEIAARAARPTIRAAGAVPAERVRAAVEVLGNAWAHAPDRNSAHLALAGGLLRAGWSEDDAADFMADVAEIEQPGNADPARRAAIARATAGKLESGSSVAGWPSLEGYLQGDGAAVVRRACGLLGIESATPDTAAVASFVARARAGRAATPAALAVPEAPPLDSLVDTALAAARTRLNRKHDLASKHEGELLGRVIKGEPLTKDVGEDRERALCQAAIVVAREVPPGTSPEKIAEILYGAAGTYAGDLDEIVGMAVEHVEAQKTAAPADGEFDVDPETNRPRASQANIVLALLKLECALSYDALACRKIMERDGERAVLGDVRIVQLMLEIEREYKFRPPKDYFYDIMTDQAHLNSYHPVLQYLDALPAWDGVPRCGSWLIDYAGAEDNPYVREVSRLMLVAAVRRVRQPGCKFDEMLILESPQGKDKSSALRALCADPTWFTDDLTIGADTKEQMEKLAGKWIVEAGELKGMSKGDHASLKQFLSRQVDEARMAYGREPERRPRQCVFFGSTNEFEYLEDETGNRRYWPVRIVAFVRAQIVAIRDQLWAEAAMLEAANPDEGYIRMDPALYAAAAAVQESRRPEDPWVGILHAWLARPRAGAHGTDQWSLAEIGLSVFQIEHKDLHRHTRRISSALRACGLESKAVMIQGRAGQSRVWRRIENKGSQ